MRTRPDRNPISVTGVHVDTGKTIYFDSLYQANKFGFHQDAIRSVLKGKKETYNGYRWFKGKKWQT